MAWLGRTLAEARGASGEGGGARPTPRRGGECGLEFLVVVSGNEDSEDGDVNLGGEMLKLKEMGGEGGGGS